MSNTDETISQYRNSYRRMAASAIIIFTSFINGG